MSSPVAEAVTTTQPAQPKPSSPPPAAGQFKAFVTQTQLDERRQKRQEEWEKVRKPDEPIEAPEDAYDPRSLYHRLQEQKDKKQAEFEEQHKLKNMIKGLDDDEVNFLDFVDKTREEMENRRLEEDGRVIAEYRKAVAVLAEESECQRLKELKNATTGLATATAAHSSQSASTPVPTTQRRTSQSVLLAGAVKRKSVDKTEDVEDANKRLKSNEDDVVETGTDNSTAIKPANESNLASEMTCIGVLPGLGLYTDSSDSEQSSDESETDLPKNNYDLLGRTRWQATQAAHTQPTSASHGRKA